MNQSQTIAAISTPLGESGLGVIRISGPESLQIISNITKTNKKGIIPRKTYLKLLWDIKNKTPVEQGIIIYYKSPKSYTGEDMVEISTHGSIVLLKYVLEILIKEGAVLATTGEFSKRAFLNGKMDLSQAEGIINLIRAKTKLGAGYAFEQVKGRLSDTISCIREELINILANLEVSLDFEEDMGIIDKKGLINNIKKIFNRIEKLRETYNEGKILKDGIRVIILGKPNVGKSTLLNILLKEERAIVTSIPGTTRDTIEEAMDINGVPIVLVDTAGFQATKNYVEKLGQARARQKLNESDLVLLMCDARKGFDQKDEKILNLIKDKKAVILYNKTDLCTKQNKRQKRKKGIAISAKKELGIDKLKEEIVRFVGDRVFERNSPIILNVRHFECLIKTEEAIKNLLQNLINQTPLDLCAIDLKEAVKALGEISGEEVSEEVIDKIFKEFCVGK